VNRRLVIRPAALEEIFEAADWYERRGPGLSAEFLRALDALIASIERAPEEYPKVHEQMRHALLRRFPYSIIFREDGGEIVVVACTHWRRHPRHWRDRR
jgi:plasmid stabilization system protein ParE